MTHDVNAAVEGAIQGGAREVWVKDSHGNSKNLLIDKLHPRAILVSGQGTSDVDGMMNGIDASFDLAFLVGYHARAGTVNGVMEHTITGGIHRLWMNGEECGEIGLSAGVAGRYGVPIGLVVSDRAGTHEAMALIEGLTAWSTKEGTGRYMARLNPLEENRERIAEMARFAVESRQAKPYVFEGPTDLRIEFNRAEEADMTARLPGLHRHDGYTVDGTFPTFEDAHRLIWCAVEMSFRGLAAMD